MNEANTEELNKEICQATKQFSINFKILKLF